MQTLASEQLLELQEELMSERAHLEDLRGGGRLTTQAQLDSAQAELRDAAQVSDTARARHDQVLIPFLSHMVTLLIIPTQALSHLGHTFPTCFTLNPFFMLGRIQ